MDEPIKILIVDDEEIIREGMKQIIQWDEYGIGVLHTACSGIEALDYAYSAKPDIYLCDIRMPGMDGLTFINEARKLTPDSLFIIISGYNDFEYAKKAIGLGAFNYLLKPVQVDELIDVTKRSLQKILSTRMHRIEEEKLARQLTESMPVIRSNYIMNLLQGNLECSMERLTELGIDIINEVYSVFCVSLNITEIDGFQQYKYLILLKEKMEVAVQNTNYNHFKYYFMMDSSDIKGIVSATTETYNSSLYKKSFTELFQLAQNAVRSYDEFISPIFGVGHGVNSLKDISASFELAKKALEYRIIKKDVNIFYAEELFKPQRIKSRIFSSLDMKKLAGMIEESKPSEIENILTQLKKKMECMEGTSPSFLYSFILEILVSISQFLYESGFEVDDIYNMDQFSYNYLFRFKDLDELFKWLTGFILHISASFCEFISGRKKRVIEDIKQYVQKNISENISLQALAEKYYYNPSYISRLFKEELGINFIDFVVEQKVQYAMKLLRETNYKFYTISEMAGYKDYKYFSRSFKNITGMTPIEYRNKRI